MTEHSSATPLENAEPKTSEANAVSKSEDHRDDFARSLVEFEASTTTPVHFDEADREQSHENASRTMTVEALLDVPVTVTAVLGRRSIDVASLTALETGSILGLDRKVGDPVDLYINDQLIARGELVIADGRLGISMTEITQPTPAMPDVSTEQE